MKLKALVIGLFALPVMAADTPDASFYKKAAEGGLAEVQLGQLAQEKSNNPAVKDFGALMVKDHSAANDKLKSIAATKKISLPASPGAGEMASKEKQLQMLSGEAFDSSYIKGMVKDHEEDIKEFQREAKNGQDPDAKAFAAATLPTLQEHLKKIRAIAAANNVSAD